MVFDEPSTSLDADAKRYIDKLLYQKFPNITKVIVTHDLNQASKADKILVIGGGGSSTGWESSLLVFLLRMVSDSVATGRTR